MRPGRAERAGSWGVRAEALLAGSNEPGEAVKMRPQRRGSGARQPVRPAPVLDLRAPR